MVTVSAYFLLAGMLNPLKKRVQTVAASEEQRQVKPHASIGMLKALGQAVIPKELSKRLKISTLLEQAGFRDEGDINIFYGLKLLFTTLGPLLTIVFAVFTASTPLSDAAPFALAAAGLGFLLPDIVLRKLVKRRQDSLRRGLPDALDLLVVCSEAGLGLNAGIQRVGQEISITHPALADELQLVTMQSRAGMDNRSALKGLEERTGLDDIQALVATLTQSMRFGTSIGDTLRIYSAELRDKRLQRAQEKAAKISSLMLFPLVTCILPSFLLVILGPAMIGLMKAFQQMPTGG
jgi:tight adherence protein C